MYAVIETGGKQYRVQPGDVVKIEKLNVEEGQEYVFDKVLLVGDGSDLAIGRPYVANASVKVIARTHAKGDKVIVFHYKSKKNYRRFRGHRQWFTEVEIKSIER